ncbi:MAG: LysR family transcriptional regulator [Candidatus Krumholzibacteria bacterium]|nr:LysR family transcriptional regulator [Candidatus Krumholzibacteria bacterium]MDP7021428.1 LysR family transcriptional regulator [Candidatus Krumholzibacteria bacterium]
MELHQLKAFLALAEEGSFTLAAEKLYLSQSAVSQSIARLEESLGEGLLQRRRGKLRLSEAGELFLPRARQGLEALQKGAELVESLSGLQRGKLSIGAVDVAALDLLPRLFQRFRTLYPGIEISVQVGGSRRLREELESGKLDLAILFSREEPEAMNSFSLGHDEMCIIAPAGKKDPEGYISYPRNSVTREILEESFARQGIPFPVLMEIDRPEVILQLVRSGLGRAVLPRRLLQRWSGERGFRRLRPRSLKLQRPLYLLHPDPESLSPACRTFLEESEKTLKKGLGFAKVRA